MGNKKRGTRIEEQGTRNEERGKTNGEQRKRNEERGARDRESGSLVLRLFFLSFAIFKCYTDYRYAFEPQILVPDFLFPVPDFHKMYECKISFITVGLSTHLWSAQSATAAVRDE